MIEHFQLTVLENLQEEVKVFSA